MSGAPPGGPSPSGGSGWLLHTPSPPSSSSSSTHTHTAMQPPLPPSSSSSSSASSHHHNNHHHASLTQMRYKVLHLLRHGVAVHNQPESHKLPPEALFDPSLTVQGVAQANAAKAMIQALHPQLVITSPLTRALQTATAILPPSSTQGTATSTSTTTPTSSSSSSSAASSSSRSTSPSSPPSPPIVALEIVREAYGAYLPDKRRTKAELKAAFSPAVDLSTLPEEDNLWTPTRESLESVLRRARTLLQDLLPRPERTVLLVSHGVFLQCLLQELLLGNEPPSPEWDRSRQVMNCELYSVIVVEMDPRLVQAVTGSGSNHLGSPPPLLSSSSSFSSPLGGSGGGGSGSQRQLRQLLVTPATHELLALSGLTQPQSSTMAAMGMTRGSESKGDGGAGAAAATKGGNRGFFEEVVCWMAHLFLAYSQGQYRLPLQAFTQLLNQCGVEEAFVCERYFKALSARQQQQQQRTTPTSTTPTPTTTPTTNTHTHTHTHTTPGLSFEDFLVGLVAMDPQTANQGPWRRLRAEFIFKAYDLDDDGDLSFQDFRLVVEDMLRFKLPVERRGSIDCAEAEKEARRLHHGGRCSQEDFVGAVDKMQFQGTGVLFRTLRSPIKCDAAARQALLDGSPPPHTQSPPTATRPGGGGGGGGGTGTYTQTPSSTHSTSTTRRSSGGGGGDRTSGRPPHPHNTPSASVVKVNSRQICFDVSKQRYSMSPHDKEPHRKLLQQQERQQRDGGGGGGGGDWSVSGRRRRTSNDSDRGGGGNGGGGAIDAEEDGHNNNHHNDDSGGESDGDGSPFGSGGLTPPMSPAQCTAHRIIRLLLDWDPNKPLGEPGVFSVLTSLQDLHPLLEELKSLLAAEPTVLEVRTPTRIFGDIHGQLGDLLRLFKAYGRPDRFGDINLVDYVFNGDFVDRGPCSCDVVLLLFSLKVAYPRHIYLIRGNHESRVVNANYGFKAECLRRLGNEAGALLWEMCNGIFDYLPLAARVERRILVLHGGLGATLTRLEQLQDLQRPIYDGQTGEEPLGQLLRDVLWSDPTASDTVTGLQDSPRGAGIALFGPDRVNAFCRENDLDVVVRSHQVVGAGYEFFAGKRLITVFSATDYCGQHKNHGALLEVDRDLVITPKQVKDNKTSQWAMPRNSSPPRARVP